MDKMTNQEMEGLADQVCEICGRRSRLISATLRLCGDCIRAQPDKARRVAHTVHGETREMFELPAAPPRTEGGVQCPLCTRECRIHSDFDFCF